MTSEKYRTLTPLFRELRGERVLIRPYQEHDAQSLFEAIAESRDHLRPGSLLPIVTKLSRRAEI